MGRITATVTEPRYLDVPGCAAYLSMTEPAIRSLVQRGEIPHVKIGRRLRFDRTRLDTWVQKMTTRGARRSA